MKRQSYLAIWGMATAMGFAAVTLPVHADEKDKTTSSSISTKSGQNFGHIERANKVIGKEVRSSDNQKIGKIDDLVVDLESGRVLYAVLGSGGVLGAGEKKHAVSPQAFEQGSGDNYRLNIDKAKFDGAPEFTKDIAREGEISKADFLNRTYEYYGHQPWWKGDKPAAAGTFNNVFRASELMGMKVENVSNEDMGKVENLGVDLPAGRVVYVILAPDRSLDLGDKFFALPPDAVTRNADRKALSASITKEKLAGAPHIDKDNWTKMSDRSWASQVYQYYGKSAYFDTVQPTSDRPKERVYPEKK